MILDIILETMESYKRMQNYIVEQFETNIW